MVRLVFLVPCGSYQNSPRVCGGIVQCTQAWATDADMQHRDGVKSVLVGHGPNNAMARGVHSNDGSGNNSELVMVVAGVPVSHACLSAEVLALILIAGESLAVWVA